MLGFLRIGKSNVGAEEIVTDLAQIGTFGDNINLFSAGPATQLNIGSTFPPIYPSNTDVSMRGGAGDSVIVY